MAPARVRSRGFLDSLKRTQTGTTDNLPDEIGVRKRFTLELSHVASSRRRRFVLPP